MGGSLTLSPTRSPMLRTLCLAVAIVSTVGSLNAQTSSPDEFAEFVDSWKGRWIGHYDKRDTRLDAHVRCRAVSGGKALIADVSTAEWSGVWMVTYDASSETIKTLWSASTGETGQATIHRDGTTWTIQGKGTTDGGEAEKYVNTVTVSDDGGHHRWDFSSVVNGSPESWSGDFDRVEK